jgi:ribosomal protein L40E
MLTCPFCHTEVPIGAVVCRGCHAEIDYARAKEKLYTTVGSALFGAFVSFLAFHKFSNSDNIVIGGGIVFGALGGYLAHKMFKQPIFKRIQKT